MLNETPAPLSPVFAPPASNERENTPDTSAPPADATNLADALLALERLPLTPDERAAVLRRLLA